MRNGGSVSRLLNKVTVLFLVLALVGTLGLSCGGGGGGKKTITIGFMSDLTGYTSGAVYNIYYGFGDLVRYYNDEGLIPGVKLNLVTWDTNFSAARTVPGYDWLKDKGADLIVTVLGQDGDALKSFADRDKFPLFSFTTTTNMIEPPGWVFTFSCRNEFEMVTLLKWISEEQWDYSQGIPKVGFLGQSEPLNIGIEKGMREYCQAHPDKFDYVRGILVPTSQTTFIGEVPQLKDCDYICAYSLAGISFIRDYRDRGYSRATFLDPSSFPSFEGLVLDNLGWEAIDGMLTATSSLTWTETEPHAMQDLARQLLDRYRHSQAQGLIRQGTGYFAAGVISGSAMLTILGNAIEAVGGAENLSSQAIYDAAVAYKTGGTLWQGFPEWGFSQTKRYLYDDARIYEWNATQEDIVRVQDWIPLVTEW
jgi:hypothetical protein